MTRLLELPKKYTFESSGTKRKFGNIPTTYNGRRYDSKKEAEFAQQLDAMRHAQGRDKVDSWEPQVRFPLVVSDVTVGHIVVDFFVRYADGRRELVEIKSAATQTALFKFKLKVFRACFLDNHPDINYLIVT
jgi:hypothetical protein